MRQLSGQSPAGSVTKPYPRNQEGKGPFSCYTSHLLGLKVYGIDLLLRVGVSLEACLVINICELSFVGCQQKPARSHTNRSETNGCLSHGGWQTKPRLKGLQLLIWNKTKG